MLCCLYGTEIYPSRHCNVRDQMAYSSIPYWNATIIIEGTTQNQNRSLKEIGLNVCASTVSVVN